jgi:hypothetical protein
MAVLPKHQQAPTKSFEEWRRKKATEAVGKLENLLKPAGPKKIRAAKGLPRLRGMAFREHEGVHPSTD